MLDDLITGVTIPTELPKPVIPTPVAAAPIIVPPTSNPPLIVPQPIIQPIPLSSNGKPQISTLFTPPADQEPPVEEIPTPQNNPLNISKSKPGSKKNAKKTSSKKKKSIVIVDAPSDFSTLSDLSRLHQPVAEVSKVPTGSIVLDYTFGGGWPLGVIIEAYSHEAVGKTTTFLGACGCSVKSLNRHALYLDYEFSIILPVIENIGIPYVLVDDQTDWKWVRDNPCLIILQPDTFEQGENIIVMVLRELNPALIVIDSLAGMVPEEILNSPSGSCKPGIAGKCFAQMWPKMVRLMRRHNCTLVVINQTRTIMNSGMKSFGPSPETSYASNTVKFYATIRFKITKGDWLEETTFNPLTNANEVMRLGQEIKLWPDKNKQMTPKPCSFFIRYGKGIFNPPSLFKILQAYKFAFQAGSGFWFSLDIIKELGIGELNNQGEPKKVIGKRQWYEYLQTEEIYPKLVSYLKTKGIL